MMQTVMTAHLKLVLILLVLLVLPVGAYTNLIEPNKNEVIAIEIPFSSIDKGLVSNIKTSQGLVIKEQFEWYELWRKHLGRKNNYDNIAPQVDFSQLMVIAVFAGSHSFSSIKVEKIIDNGNNLNVYVKSGTELINKPNIDGSEVCPYEFIKLAKSSKPVVFHMD